MEGMVKASKPNPGKSRGRRKAPEPTSTRLPIRISVDREALHALDKRAIAAQAGIGIVAGWLASWLVGGSGLLQYVITGLAGSLVGGFVLERLGIDLGIRNQTASRIVTATIGALIVVLLARIIG
ncbi:GlsB/YeaQ/YmgE family stress response membrane protein [Microvirga yunnanensis]|uniref:GlsB/YeaQ/YmgE family stress response membrane protein n=1 Tax=Microvirga yunnanensis TaxID=2953740 RepID=UPI00290569A7|nr:MULTISPECIES: GlsB/YeaQ/YmgE family stress response membrane protein [unclassified Microvirga]